jgi:predicted ArsR family transcriptional regulator
VRPGPAGPPPGAAAPSAFRPASDLSAQARSERSTRARVARLILELGPSTASVIGNRLGLTPAAIRRHLDNLLAEGHIETRTARTYASRGRGRPARLFAITDAGRSAFEHAYDDLASSALRFLAEMAGPAAVAGAPAGERVQALADALSADGYAASTVAAPAAAASAGEQLCQHHCPVAHVAAEFPQLCEAETEAFSRLLGRPVRRLATIAHGDGICTTHVTCRSLADSADSADSAKDGAGKHNTPGPVEPRGDSETIPESGGLFL